MKQIEVEYAIQRNGETIFENEAIVNIPESFVEEIIDYILSDKTHQTAELIDIPAHIYDNILDQVSDDADNKTHGGIMDNDDIGLQTFLPVSLVELLPDNVIDTFPDELFSDTDDDAEDDDQVQFLMDIENAFMVKGKGLVFAGTIVGGVCKVGDAVLLVDEQDEVVAESKIKSIKVEQRHVTDLSTLEDTEGLDISIMTDIQTSKVAKSAVSLIVE